MAGRKILKAMKRTEKRVGAPSTFSQKTADEICKRIAEGEGLRTICETEGMPGRRTVYAWLETNTEFQHQYARARDQQAVTYADDIVNIADTEEDPNKARVRIDARKWHASKLAPKKYGDKLELAGDPESPLKVVHAVEQALDAKLDRLIGRKAEGD